MYYSISRKTGLSNFHTLKEIILDKIQEVLFLDLHRLTWRNNNICYVLPD